MRLPVITLVAFVVIMGRVITYRDPYDGRPFDPAHDDAWERYDRRVADAESELRVNFSVLGLAFAADVMCRLLMH